jgi:hypothetical protein
MEKLNQSFACFHETTVLTNLENLNKPQQMLDSGDLTIRMLTGSHM